MFMPFRTGCFVKYYVRDDRSYWNNKFEIAWNVPIYWNDRCDNAAKMLFIRIGLMKHNCRNQHWNVESSLLHGSAQYTTPTLIKFTVSAQNIQFIFGQAIYWKKRAATVFYSQCFWLCCCCCWAFDVLLVGFIFNQKFSL